MQGPSAGIETTTREVAKIRGELHTNYAGRTGKTCAQNHAAPLRNYWPRADEARKHGLIDEVLTRQP